MTTTDQPVALITTAYRDGSTGPCEDRVYVGSSAVVVLDGGAHVDQFAVDLMARLELEPAVDLGAAIPRPGPDGGLGIARWTADSVEILAIGQNPVVVRRRDGTVMVMRGDVRTSWSAGDIDCVLLATDGAAHAVDVYAAFPDWSTAVEVAIDSPQALLDAIHEVEEDDPLCLKWPRTQLHPDKALAVIALP